MKASSSAHPAADPAERVRTLVLAEGQRWRQRHPILQHQDALGVAWLLFAWAGVILSAWGYVIGAWSAWVTVPMVAFFASITHELEHDLIHWMYFRKRPWAHHLMMACVWLARPSTINPWIRRHLHFQHHKASGTAEDYEERAITNGERWGWLRLWMTADNVMAVVLRVPRAPTWKLRRRMMWRAALGYFPLGWINWGLWYLFLAYHLGHAVGLSWAQSWSAAAEWVDTLVVIWIGPNVLRTFCLHFVSSNMHYFGDVEPGNVVQQTQVLNPWWMWPLQLFCCNFGSTHAIHHFVVKEPFYIRQLTAPVAHRAMREAGVRFNDFGTFKRANRWSADAGWGSSPSNV
ncbi:MAG TPA: fatty acid desaturase [Aquabacterium sp.]|nr:fatty acid desaturase [Aquabacterium sp.]